MTEMIGARVFSCSQCSYQFNEADYIAEKFAPIEVELRQVESKKVDGCTIIVLKTIGNKSIPAAEVRPLEKQFNMVCPNCNELRVFTCNGGIDMSEPNWDEHKYNSAFVSFKDGDIVRLVLSEPEEIQKENFRDKTKFDKGVKFKVLQINGQAVEGKVLETTSKPLLREIAPIAKANQGKPFAVEIKRKGEGTATKYEITEF